MPPAESQEQQSLSSTSASILKERRFKLSRACDRCRRRRIKCDEGHPCQACLAANSACTFEEPGKRTHPHKSKRTATLEDRMHHLETLIQAIPPAVFAGLNVGNMSPSLSDQLQTTSSIPSLSIPTPTGHVYGSGVPPPSLHVFPLINPSTHFTPNQDLGDHSPNSPFHSLFGGMPNGSQYHSPDQLSEETARMSLSASYLYFDDEGYTRWQGETSGLPLLDLLVERHSQTSPIEPDRLAKPESPWSDTIPEPAEWFPNRIPRRADINPETLWRLITSYIVPELMDSLVQCYLSTSYYILPFLHVPTFLADYGNPQKWGEPGFAAFIVAVCCLASRHMNDPRVRADPEDGISAGTQWFELLHKLRTLPIADRPTIYTIQADLIAGVYAVGLGKLSKAAALLSEAITTSIDAGLHRSADTYDLFDPIEDEVRKRTFWCVYIWDKQLCAHFGRPPMIRLRDCDVGEPAPVDDEFITKDGIGIPPVGTECRLSAFVVLLRIMVVLESVLDVSPSRHTSPDGSNSFLSHAASLLNPPSARRTSHDMKAEEMLLDEIHRSIPAFWAHTPETLGSDDTIRVTQAVRIHCAENFVRLLLYRHRFSELFAERTNMTLDGAVKESFSPTQSQTGSPEQQQGEVERQAMSAAYHCALQIVSTHLNVATKGLMTYYGVHVIHQLTQAGRTLVAILLNCKSDPVQHLIPSALDALRSCVGLLRRFSGRYICGLRSGDLMEEFCRITQIPLEPLGRSADGTNDNANSRPPWIRPVRKKNSSLNTRARRSKSFSGTGDTSTSSQPGSSPETFSPEFLHDLGGGGGTPPHPNSYGGANGTLTPGGGVTGSSPIPPFGLGLGGGSPYATMDSDSRMYDALTSASGGAGVGGGDVNMGTTMMFNDGVDVSALFNGDLGLTVPTGLSGAQTHRRVGSDL